MSELQNDTPPSSASSPGLTAWPADEIVRRDPASLKPNPKNPRKHSPEQIKMIRSAMDEFGWTVPCVIDEKDQLWGGHGRRLAALVVDEQGQALDYSAEIAAAAAAKTVFVRPEPLPEVPCVIARNWTAHQKRAYLLAENRLPELSTTDFDVMRDHLRALDGVFDLAKAGFDALMLPQFLADPNAGKGDPDEFYVPTEMPVEFIEPGEVWRLGEHRIVCGDATDPAIVAAVIAGDIPNLMVSDPPYGVDYDPKWRDRVKRSDGSKVRAKAIGLVQGDLKDDWREAWALFPGNVVYIWHGGLHSNAVQASLEAVGFLPRAQIIWAKHQFVIGRGDYHWQHECCWYMVRKGKTGKWNGDRKQSTIWSIAAPSGWAQVKEGADAHTGIHSTQKMVECMARPIRNNSKPGDFIYEPFNGSGTTIIACEVEGRRCLAVELSPAYVQVAIERWEKFSGKTARLGDETYAEIKAKRLGEINAASDRREPVSGPGEQPGEPVDQPAS